MCVTFFLLKNKNVQRVVSDSSFNKGKNKYLCIAMFQGSKFLQRWFAD